MFEPAVIGPGDGRQRSRPLLRTMLGEVLRRTRLEQDRTLADVARAARVSMPYLSEVERGRKEASSEILAAICDALHLDLSDLLTEVGAPGRRYLAGARQAQVIRLGGDHQPPGRTRGRWRLARRCACWPRDPQALSSSADPNPAGTALRLSMTLSASPYSTASIALNVLFRSVSARILATG